MNNGPVNGSTSVGGKGSNGNGLADAAYNAAPLLALSQLVDRIALFSRAGFSSHDGARNLFEAVGFKIDLTLADYREAYARGGIARRIIDFFPEETWRGGVSLVENEDPDTETPFETEWEEIRDRLQIVKTLRRADRLARLGQYACILIGTSRAGELSAPLPSGSSLSQIIYLTVYAEDQATIKKRVTSPTDIRWGLPESYTLKVDTNGDGLSVRDVTVHWSRIIHVCHDSLESDTAAQPMLQAPYNDLYSLWKLVWGGAETSWRNARRFTVANLDASPTVQFAPDYVEKLEEKLIEAQHGLKDNIITRGTDVSVLGGPVDKFDANGNFLLDLIGGTVQIQKRNLLGSEKVGELASGLDRKRNADAISSAQEGFADPLVRDLVSRLVDYGYMTGTKKKGPNGGLGHYACVFAVEEEMGEDEKAEYAERIARANKDQKQAEGKVIRTSDEIRDYLWDAEPLEEPEEQESQEPEETLNDDPGQADPAFDPDATETGERTAPLPSVNSQTRAQRGVDRPTSPGPVSRLKLAKLRLQKKREKGGR